MGPPLPPLLQIPVPDLILNPGAGDPGIGEPSCGGERRKPSSVIRFSMSDVRIFKDQTQTGF